MSKFETETDYLVIAESLFQAEKQKQREQQQRLKVKPKVKPTVKPSSGTRELVRAQRRELEPVVRMLPTPVKSAVVDAAVDPQMNAGVREVMARAAEFSTPLAAMLAGIALDPVARAYVNERLDNEWSKVSPLNKTVDEIIVGGGLHAAIYCAVRRALGKPAPLVLEQRNRVGGAFSVTYQPSFFLNSRNRPGGTTIPGRTGALNYIPGAPVQPADLGGGEFQTNDVLAWVIRATLAMYAKVRTGVTVTNWGTMTINNLISVENSAGYPIKAKRLIFATGLGEPKKPNAKSERFLSFDDLMRRMETPFPLRGMNKVAVIGGGDSARTAVEALSGQGPRSAYSLAALDWVREIDWYGCPALSRTAWRDCNRTRYTGLASLLPQGAGADDNVRVRPLPRASGFAGGYQSAYVNEIPYDYVILCMGYRNITLEGSDWVNSSSDGRVTSLTDEYGRDVHLIGPAAELAVSSSEEAILRGIDENKTSIFRYAPRTAALAASLD